MITDYRILTLGAGFTAVGSAFLLFSTVIEVDREGVGHDQISTFAPWRPRTYKRSVSHGLIQFNPAEPGATGGEKVYVLYKR